MPGCLNGVIGYPGTPRYFSRGEIRGSLSMHVRTQFVYISSPSRNFIDISSETCERMFEFLTATLCFLKIIHAFCVLQRVYFIKKN